MFSFFKSSPENEKPKGGVPPAIFVYITCGNLEEAEKISAALVEQKLIACANIMGPHRAIYRWEGKVIASDEVPVLLKTRKDMFEKVRQAIVSMHSYECPCIAAIPITQGHSPYMKWIADNTLKVL